VEGAAPKADASILVPVRLVAGLLEYSGGDGHRPLGAGRGDAEAAALSATDLRTRFRGGSASRVVPRLVLAPGPKSTEKDGSQQVVPALWDRDFDLAV
jgi:hypothetical protein